MRIGEYFKKIRLEKNLSEEDIARNIGPEFQASLLWDFESGDDNDIDGFTINIFKKYCEQLGIKPAEFADIPIKDIGELSLSKIVMERRIEKGFTVEDLANHIGYESIVIIALEEGKLDQVCLDALKQVSIALDIPFRVLLEKV